MTARVGVVFGTRPEIIKLAPVIHALGDRALCVFTGQHYDAQLVDAIFTSCNLPVPVRTVCGVGGRSRIEQISVMLGQLNNELSSRELQSVVVQGDTNTANAGAQAAHYLGIPVVHVEAGLRSHDRAMPEEINRQLIAMLADVHCCPTTSNADNLITSGVPAQAVHVTGNTIVEATLSALPRRADRQRMVKATGLRPGCYVLATFHRPENTDDPVRLAAIIAALGHLGRPVLLPLHPRTEACMRRAGIDAPHTVRIVPPLDYQTFVGLLAECELVVSDSGGLQEEVTVVKKPMVVVRRSTERPESIDAGFCSLVEPQDIVPAARCLTSPSSLQQLRVRPSPFGDGLAGSRIAQLAGRAGRSVQTPAETPPARPVPLLGMSGDNYQPALLPGNGCAKNSPVSA